MPFGADGNHELGKGANHIKANKKALAGDQGLNLIGWEILLLKIGEWHGHGCGKSGAFNLARGCVKVEFKTNPT